MVGYTRVQGAVERETTQGAVERETTKDTKCTKNTGALYERIRF